MGQLPLPLPASPSWAEADFIADSSNAEARAFLAEPALWPDGRLALFGPAGVGKTHLARIAARRRGWLYQEGTSLHGLPELPARGWVLDGADAAGDARALLHAINAAAEARLPLLLIGRSPPARWPQPLPDLASRLRATLAVGIADPSDGLLAALLAKLLADRQLALPPALQALILERAPRSAAALAQLVARLDAAALAAGRLDRALLVGLLEEARTAEAAETLRADRATV